MKHVPDNLQVGAGWGQGRVTAWSLNLVVCVGAFIGLGLERAAWATELSARIPKEYFVSPGGCETNSGSESAPFSSVAGALSKAEGGDIITLMPGNYAEAIVVELSGTAEFPTTVRSQRKWEAVIKPPDGHGVYTADGVTNVVIDGLEVTEAKIDGVKVGSYATVRNCWIHHATHQGVAAHNTRKTIVEFNLIEHNGTDSTLDHGIYISGTNDVVRGNVIRWNKTYGCQIYYDPPASSADCQFYNNLVYGNRDALTVWSPAGQTNYVFNNTLISESYVVLADYGTVCLTNNILVGANRKRVACAEDHATILDDYNLTSVRTSLRGEHNVTGDPGFLNPQAGLFWLRPESPARGVAAKTIVPPVDFFGRKEMKAYDLGAVQFRARLAADQRTLDPSTHPDYWNTNVFNLK
jgi:hypothetical protein